MPTGQDRLAKNEVWKIVTMVNQGAILVNANALIININVVLVKMKSS